MDKDFTIFGGRWDESKSLSEYLLYYGNQYVADHILIMMRTFIVKVYISYLRNRAAICNRKEEDYQT